MSKRQDIFPTNKASARRERAASAESGRGKPINIDRIRRFMAESRDDHDETINNLVVEILMARKLNLQTIQQVEMHNQSINESINGYMDYVKSGHAGIVSKQDVILIESISSDNLGVISRNIVSARRYIDYKRKIDNKDAAALLPETTSERLTRLAKYAAVHDAAEVARAAELLVPELFLKRPEASPKTSRVEKKSNIDLPSRDLPDTAPVRWSEVTRLTVEDSTGISRLETPPEFIRRVYSEWLGKGFTRATLRELDEPLSQALYNWLRKNPLPNDLDLPTQAEENARWAERLARRTERGEVSTSDLSYSDARRLQNAKSRGILPRS